MSDSLRFLRSYLHWASIAALLLILPATHAAGLNDTGITTCSNATQNGLSCPVADFPGQDAEFGTNGFDFTKLDAAGNDLPATATDHTCVRDNVTGLIWQVKLSDSTFTFDETAGYVTSVNSTSLCGFKDWRMPDIKELMGIADYSRHYPAIDTNYFPDKPYSWFWSGSPHADLSNYAWYVHFNVGYADGNARYYNGSVRLVRGGQSFDTFVDNADGTVTQSNTGLMWAKCSEGQSGTNCTGDAKKMNWSAALTAANNSNLGGYNDWRLPNFKELQALVDYSRYNPAIDTTQFPNTPGSWFWSGSPDAFNSNYAWGVHFGYGFANDDYRSNDVHVRLVRGGQSFDPFDSLNVNKTGSGSGSVSSNPAGINCGAICAADFNRGSEITLIAAPDANSTFGGWSGACTNKTGDCTVIMSEAQTVTATFTAKPITYSLSVSKVGDGLVKSDPAGINCGTTCSKQFISGTAVTLTAKADTGAIFSKWTGCTPIATNALQCAITLTGNKTVTAVFGTGGMADIKVTAIALTPTSPAANSTFSAKITVKNQGTATANGGYLDVWANQSAEQICGAFGEQWIEIGSLAAGASKTLTVKLRSMGAGTKTLRAFVDSWCQLPEADETNNQMTKKYTVK
ncbi:DUF1566 domain-containing protein [Chromatium okenii]|uniref:Lcl domain-containing protein n=1 Tax=Chromatium okenii TaxID=61644 RepID=UPI001902D980|nr:DUF1566 domain-containing protein [Chromatium okenii]